MHQWNKERINNNKNGMNMKVTIIRDKGEREVVNREELIGLAGLIQKGWREKSVRHLRELTI